MVIISVGVWQEIPFGLRAWGTVMLLCLWQETDFSGEVPATDVHGYLFMITKGAG